MNIHQLPGLIIEPLDAPLPDEVPYSQILEDIRNKATELWLHTGSVQMVAFIIIMFQGHRYMVLVQPEKVDNEHKNRMSTAIRGIIELADVQYVAFVSEAWMKTREKDEPHIHGDLEHVEGRTENIICFSENKDGSYDHWKAVITRNPDKLDSWQKLDYPETFHGRLSGWFKAKQN